MVASPEICVTPEEYLQLEENSTIKHEYINGYIYAMAGASDPHVTIAGNIFALFHNHVRGSGYRVYISDMKMRIKSLNRFYYPDVMVTSDQRDQENPEYKIYPCLIVEVLSDSTEAFDRGDKFADYQTIDTLKEYVLISTKKPRIECFRRNREGLWILQNYTNEHKSFCCRSIYLEATISQIYEDVNFDE
ncbi:MAG: Uma2 family endonuclease [Nostocales cyanobacterium]|nr:MAG: Uma2 family endonuclease [Nostocales cyanobacterium]